MATLTTTLFGSGSNLFGGVPDPFAVPTFKAVGETGGSTTKTPDTTDGNTLVEFKPPDSNVIGADGTSAADLLKQPLTTINQPASTITLGSGNIFESGSVSNLGGLTGNIPIFNLGGMAPSAGTSSVTPVTPTTAPTETKPKTVEDFLQLGVKPTAEEMTGLIDQRLKSAQSVNRQLGGSGNLTGQEIDQIVNEVYDDIYKKEGGLKSVSTAREAGPFPAGIPAIIPIPGLDPTTAAIITAIGLIRSGGQIATIDPNDPLGSLVNIGKGIFDPNAKPGGGGPGGGATGATSVGTIRGMTPEEAAALEEENANTRAAQDAANAAASAAAIKAAQDAQSKAQAEADAAQRAKDEEAARQRAILLASMGGEAVRVTPSGQTIIVQSGTADEGEIKSTTGGGLIAGIPTKPPVSISQTGTADEGEIKSTTGGGLIAGIPKTSISQTGTANESTSTTSCPSPETPILLPDLTTIPAGELKVGMKVRTRLEYEQVWGDYPITRVEIVKDRRLKFTFDYGTFVCSTTHKFSHDDWEWKEASNYRVGDKIQGHKILAIEDDGMGDVVVITVDEAHTYVAGPFLSHNKTQAPAVTPVPTTTTTDFTILPITTGYTLPAQGTPAQRSLFEEASKTIGALNAPVGRQLLGYQLDAAGKPVAVYSEGTGGGTVAEGISGSYGGLASGMREADVSNLFGAIGAATGRRPTTEGGYQSELSRAAAEQTAAANAALRLGNIMDAEALSSRAKALRDAANAELYGPSGSLSQYVGTARDQAMRDIEALRSAERGELSRESIRAAQQAAREAASARGQVMSRGTAAQEVLNREAAIQQRQQQARANLAQSMGQLGQGIGYQAANVFDPMAATLGQQYGMQSQNVGLNQALYNQAMGLSSGAGGYGFAQQMVNPFSQYAQDVYGTNVNALNAFAIQAANRQAALEAAKMGQSGEYARALGGLIASGGLNSIGGMLSSGVQGALNLLSGQWPGSTTKVTLPSGVSTGP